MTRWVLEGGFGGTFSSYRTLEMAFRRAFEFGKIGIDATDKLSTVFCLIMNAFSIVFSALFFATVTVLATSTLAASPVPEQVCSVRREWNVCSAVVQIRPLHPT